MDTSELAAIIDDPIPQITFDCDTLCPEVVYHLPSWQKTAERYAKINFVCQRLRLKNFTFKDLKTLVVHVFIVKDERALLCQEMSDDLDIVNRSNWLCGGFRSDRNDVPLQAILCAFWPLVLVYSQRTSYTQGRMEVENEKIERAQRAKSDAQAAEIKSQFTYLLKGNRRHLSETETMELENITYKLSYMALQDRGRCVLYEDLKMSVRERAWLECFNRLLHFDPPAGSSDTNWFPPLEPQKHRLHRAVTSNALALTYGEQKSERVEMSYADYKKRLEEVDFRERFKLAQIDEQREFTELDEMIDRMSHEPAVDEKSSVLRIEAEEFNPAKGRW